MKVKNFQRLGIKKPFLTSSVKGLCFVGVTGLLRDPYWGGLKQALFGRFASWPFLFLRLMKVKNFQRLGIKKPFLTSSVKGLCFVGVTGFEPATTCTPCKYATGLRYTPNKWGWFADLFWPAYIPSYRRTLRPASHAIQHVPASMEHFNSDKSGQS
jgi:hypothetical protein